MEEDRGNIHCGCPSKPVYVQQIVGVGETQKSLDIHIRVPKRKPAIEQIVDVFVKKPCIADVDVINDKVIVRGQFEIKTLYVACLPSQPVHAVEARRIRFTADIPICGARCGMDADAWVSVEYVDYDCDHSCRAYWHKQWEEWDRGYYCQDGCKKKHKHHFYHDDCDDTEDTDDCTFKHKKHHYDECDDTSDTDTTCTDDFTFGHKHHHDECDDTWDHGHDCETCDDTCDDGHYHHCPSKKKPRKRCREFDVSVVLCVKAQVMSCREVMIQPLPPLYPPYQGVPLKPKG